MIAVSSDKIFALSNAHFSYVFRVSPQGVLEHLHYGGPLSEPFDVPDYNPRTERGYVSHYQGHKDYNLSETLLEFPCFGMSDYRYPALHGLNSAGNSVFDLKYAGHEIVKVKPQIEGLPSARGGDCETLIVTLKDPVCKLTVRLHYTIYRDYGVLARSVTAANYGAEDLHLQHAFSSCIDVPAGDYELLHLRGTWAREMNAERMAMPKGRFVIDSARGASSAAHHPFTALMERGTSETHGKVFASTLVYSGNFAMSAEVSEFETVRFLAGINPFNFAWRLEPGETFQTPEALHVYSGTGLREMSRHWHNFIREKISPPQFKNAPRPTYLNTWEAAYFDVDEDKVLTLADKAVDTGVDMLVLDDGWFEGRNDDTSSLGDWTADRARFASGIPALAKKVKAKGLKFGLWFEPEMVSPNSNLFKNRPDWALHVPGRSPSLGRNQLTLDLSRTEVVDYIFNQVSAILCCGDIDYVKWDMNRNMTEVGSAALPKSRQQETAHRYMLGLYSLLDRLTKAYPNVLFENCSGGGNRCDLGMLHYMTQSWTSDMCDPVGRLSIINGLSYLYPLDTSAAYIGPSPNHQNGRISSLKTRFLAGAFCAAKGVSLSEAEIDADMPEIRRYMQRAKAMAPDMLGGRFDRLTDTDNAVCWQYTTADARTVYLAYFHILSAPNLPFRRACMTGLDANAVYTLDEDGTPYRGDVLMQSGMPLPYVSSAQGNPDMRYMDKGDFSAHLFVFKKSSSHET